MHEKIRNHSCQECGYAALLKSSLMFHMASVHKIGDQQFKCDQCPFKTVAIYHLNRHIKGVHDSIKNYECEEREFANLIPPKRTI